MPASLQAEYQFRPTFSPAGGNYKARQTVTISASTAGATTRHTQDGTTRTESNMIVGTSVSISNSETLKALAYKSGMTDSTFNSANYTIGKKLRGAAKYYSSGYSKKYRVSSERQFEAARRIREGLEVFP